MTPRIAELVRQLVVELAREDRVLPECGMAMLEWQATGSVVLRVGQQGEVTVEGSCVQTTIEPAEMVACRGGR